MTRGRKILTWSLASLVLLLAALVVFIATFDWNLIKPTLNEKVSAALNRPFAINGNLAVAWRREEGEEGWRAWIPWPRFSAEDITLGNPEWTAGKTKASEFASLERIEFRLAPLPLLWQTIRIPQIKLTQPRADLLRLADGRWLSAEALVLANGIHAGELCAELPIRPKKGHLLITDRYPGTLRHQLVELGYVSSAHASSGTSVAFNAQPRPTGQIFLGSSRQFDTLDPQVEGPVLARMLRRALDYLPGLAGLNAIRAWTGFRAATPDGLPLLGEHPAQPGLWLAVGHEGLGVTTAPGSARLLAAQLFGETPPLDPTPYLPRRFLFSSGSARP